MATPTVDKRVSQGELEPETIEEISSQNMVSEGAPVPLTPEQIVAQEQAPVETDDGTEAKKLEAQQAAAEADEAALRQTLQEQGPCILLRFEHSNSLNYLITPGQPVSDTAILAAARDLVFKIETARARELNFQWDEREAQMERLALPGMNREQRRAMKFRK